MTTTREPFDKDCAACSAWSRHTTTVKNDGSCSRRPGTATQGAYLLRSAFKRLVWRPAVERVGVDGLRVYDLRHTAATLAAAAGATTRS